MTVIKSDSVPVIIRTPVENDIEIVAANTATIAVRFNTNFDNNCPTFRDHILLKNCNIAFNPLYSFTDMNFRNINICAFDEYNPQLNYDAVVFIAEI